MFEICCAKYFLKNSHWHFLFFLLFVVLVLAFRFGFPFFFFLLVFDLVSCFFSAGWLMVFNFLLTLCGVFRFGQFCDFGCIWFDCW